MYKFVIGTDVEEFISDPNGNVVSAIGMLPGSKENQHALSKGMCQVDCMSAEWGVTPSNDPMMLYYHIQGVREQVTELLPPGHSLVTKATHDFDIGEILDGEEDGSMVAGCEPDFNAWAGGEENEKPDLYDTLRVCGGHVHVGSKDITDVNEFVKRLDLYLGIPSLMYTDDGRRRELYGRAGSYRVKPYGVEYRTLSNFWIKDEAFVQWVYNGVHRALTDTTPVPDNVEEIINSNDVEAATKMYDELQLGAPAK